MENSSANKWLTSAICKNAKSLDEARFCTNCVANDFIIPGLEFDEQGRCPMCKKAEKAAENAAENAAKYVLHTP